MKRVRIGLVGCGRRGTYLTSLFKAHTLCEVTTLMDRSRACAEKSAESLALPDARIDTDFETMLREAKIDAVLITGDPTQQAQMACRAMERGIHACTEVPAAFAIDDLWQLVQTVQKTGCKYQLMEQVRYWGFIEQWMGMHERDELGHICHVQGEYVHYESTWNLWYDPATGEQFHSIKPPAGRTVKPTWRQTVFEHPIYYLPHTLSPLLRILKDRVLRVSCMGTQKLSYTYPDTPLAWRDIEYAMMHTEKDTVMTVGAGFSMPHVYRGPLSAHWYELRGVKGSVTSPRFKDDAYRVWKRGDETYKPVEMSTTPLDADASQAASGHGGADFKPIDTFIRSILDDTTPPLDVYLTAELTAPAILAAESSERGGVTLDVPDFRKPRA